MSADHAAAWRTYASRLRLRYQPLPPSAFGVIQGFEVALVSVAVAADRAHRHHARLVVSARGRLPGDVSKAAESILTRLPTAVGSIDRIGPDDPAIGVAARVAGDPVLSLQLLDAVTRSRLESVLPAALSLARGELAAAGVSLASGDLVWESRRLDVAPETLVDTTEALVALAKELSVSEQSHSSLLAATARSDPSPFLRLRSLESLVLRFPERWETVDAARSALSDPSITTRLVAAECLRREDAGIETLREIALDRIATPRLRAGAVLALVRSGDLLRTRAVLDTLLREGDPAMLLPSIRAAGALGHVELLPRLVTLVPDVAGAVAEALADAIGRIGSPEGEEAALALLRLEDRLVRVAAARALGQVGSLPSVEALRPLTKGIGELGDAATEALRAIRSRIAPGGGGGLSLDAVPPGSGRLSDPSPAHGALGEPEERSPE